MTKQQELDILKSTIQQLGPDSYIGPWLAEQLPGIERDIRSDIQPLVTWADCREQTAAELAAAREIAAEIRKVATEELTRACQEARSHRDQTIAFYRQQIRNLGEL